MAITIEILQRCSVAEVPRLIRQLALAEAEHAGELVLDLRGVRFLEPLGVCVLLSFARRWQDARRKVGIEVDFTSEFGTYAARMDLLAHLGVVSPLNRTRHPPRDNFVTIREVGPGTAAPQLAREVATCLVTDIPGEQGRQTQRLMEYLLGEVILNCIQHSSGRGFLHGQFYPDSGQFHLALADDGIGILDSYASRFSPRYKLGMTDTQMLDESLRVGSSSTTHRRGPNGESSPNFGIGLPMCRVIAEDAVGHFALISGDAALIEDYGQRGLRRAGASACGAYYKGVAVGVSFLRSTLGQATTESALADARIKLGLQSPGGWAGYPTKTFIP
jgi:hypothetical protein